MNVEKNVVLSSLATKLKAKVLTVEGRKAALAETEELLKEMGFE